MEINVERAKCIGLGVCEEVSSVFELDDEGELIVHDHLIPETDVDELRRAVQSCPVKALTLVTR